MRRFGIRVGKVERFIVIALLLTMVSAPLVFSQGGPSVVGGGWFYEGAARNIFSIHVSGTGRGVVNYYDGNQGYRFYGYEITDFYLDPDNTAHVFGYGKLNNEGVYLFHAMAVDNGDQGVGVDAFHLWIFGYTLIDYSFGDVERGNIRVS